MRKQPTTKLLAPLVLGTIVLGGCTYAFPVAPLDPGVATSPKKTIVAEKRTEVCNGFIAGISLDNPKTVEEAAKEAGITKITSIRYETRDIAFLTKFCAVVKGM